MRKYREIDKVNQSFLKMLINKNYGKEVKDAAYFDKGNMLEVLLSDEDLFDKIIVDPSDYNEASLCAEVMKTHEHTKDIIENTVHHQTIVEGQIAGVVCKGLLDGLLINDTQVPIHIGGYKLKPKHLSIIDFKSVYGSTNKFDYNIISQRYDIQAGFYKELTEQTFPDYTVQDFLFVAGSMNPTYNIPVVRQVTDKMLLGAKYGWDRDYNPCNRFSTNKFKLGYMDGIDIYKEHLEQAQWEMSPHIFTNKGFIKNELHEA